MSAESDFFSEDFINMFIQNNTEVIREFSETWNPNPRLSKISKKNIVK